MGVVHFLLKLLFLLVAVLARFEARLERDCDLAICCARLGEVKMVTLLWYTR